MAKLKPQSFIDFIICFLFFIAFAIYHLIALIFRGCRTFYYKLYGKILDWRVFAYSTPSGIYLLPRGKVWQHWHHRKEWLANYAAQIYMQNLLYGVDYND